MKRCLAIIIAALMLIAALPFSAGAASEKGTPSDFAVTPGLYVHAVGNSLDSEAWQMWQSVHDEDFVVAKPNEKFFFLPSSAGESAVDIYNGYDETVTVNGTALAAHETDTVAYTAGVAYPVTAGGQSYTLTLMRSNAEAAIYVNNPDADGNGTDLMDYLNVDKSRKATATGAIVTPDGAIDNTAIKKIKGRGNTSWDKPKKGYNITYDKKVSIAGMTKNKKYSILPNYQDDSLSRNRFLYDLSDAVGLYASDSRYVDFYVNGFYWGSYQMAEKVEAGSLVTDVDEEAYLNEDGTVREDFPFIVEVDASAGDDDYWVSTNNMKLTIKAPEIDPGAVGYDEVKNYVKTKFSQFYTAISSTSYQLSDYADIDSVAKLYLINELGKNWDSGVSSTFFTYKQDADGKYKFYGSPVWDYDNSLGNAVGVSRDLRTIGVTDYEEYTGWWCQHKGKSSATSKRSTNVIARISQNSEIKAATPRIWFEQFMPALDHFSGEAYNAWIKEEMFTRSEYFELVEASAAMNYTSGWLLDTGSWIADHSTLYPATYNAETQQMEVNSTATHYAQDFEGMYNYAADWMLSRAAWLSEQYAPDYTPSPLLGDVNGDRRVDVIDATLIQRHQAKIATLDDSALACADIDRNGAVEITDATYLQRYIAKMSAPDGIGEPI